MCGTTRTVGRNEKREVHFILAKIKCDDDEEEEEEEEEEEKKGEAKIHSFIPTPPTLNYLFISPEPSRAQRVLSSSSSPYFFLPTTLCVCECVVSDGDVIFTATKGGREGGRTSKQASKRFIFI